MAQSSERGERFVFAVKQFAFHVCCRNNRTVNILFIKLFNERIGKIFVFENDDQ